MIRRPINFVTRFLGDIWGQYTPTGQLLFLLALVAIAVDATISWEYGLSMSLAHAAGYSLVAIALALFPDLAAREADKGARAAACVLVLICCVLGGVAYQSHIGYGAGIRLGDLQQTGFHNAKVEAAIRAGKSEETNLDLWRNQRAQLAAERADIVKSSPWVTATTAIALREHADNLDKKIADEINGGRGGRAAGCKTECEKLRDQKLRVSEQIASVERLEGVTARLVELDRRIAATQRTIDAKLAAVSDAGMRSSVAVNSTTALGELWTLVSGRETPATIVNLASMGTTSLAFLILAPALMFAAGRNRRPDYASLPPIEPRPMPAPMPPSVPPHATALAPVVHRTDVVRLDEALRRWAQTPEARSLNGAA
jgi:hypothetical protein